MNTCKAPSVGRWEVVPGSPFQMVNTVFEHPGLSVGLRLCRASFTLVPGFLSTFVLVFGYPGLSVRLRLCRGSFTWVPGLPLKTMFGYFWARGCEGSKLIHSSSSSGNTSRSNSASGSCS